MADAAANSRGDGKSPKPVISDHCQMSEHERSTETYQECLAVAESSKQFETKQA